MNIGGTEVARDENVISWFLDPDIQFPNPSAVTNLEPLLINNAGSLAYRPEAVTEIPNLFLASDYVKTYTDLATMEGANEAARRAVNGILDRSGSTAPRVPIWPFQEPEFFAPLIEYDRLRFRLGLPHAKFRGGIAVSLGNVRLFRRNAKPTRCDVNETPASSVHGHFAQKLEVFQHFARA